MHITSFKALKLRFVFSDFINLTALLLDLRTQNYAEVTALQLSVVVNIMLAPICSDAHHISSQLQSPFN